MRARIFFQKTGTLRYISNLDLQKVWERIFRRANLPIQMSQGFNPHAKIQIAHPLPVGFSGKNEVVDVFLDLNISIEAMEKKLTQLLPEGLTINQIMIAPENPHSLSSLYTQAEYLVTINDVPSQAIRKKLDQILNAKSLMRERNGKEYDLRPLIYKIEIVDNSAKNVTIRMVLSSGPGKTGRPDEIILQLGYRLSDCIIERTKIF